jgi:hypothetical protein
MSTEQPEALRLANAHEQVAKGIDFPELSLQTAAELRRLHEDCEDWKKGYALLFKENADRRRLNEELVEAVKQMQSALSRCFGAHAPDEGDRHRALAASRAALAKAETP